MRLSELVFGRTFFPSPARAPPRNRRKTKNCPATTFFLYQTKKKNCTTRLLQRHEKMSRMHVRVVVVLVILYTTSALLFLLTTDVAPVVVNDLPRMVVLTSVSGTKQTEALLVQSLSRIMMHRSLWKLTWFIHLSDYDLGGWLCDDLIVALNNIGFEVRQLRSLTELSETVEDWWGPRIRSSSVPLAMLVPGDGNSVVFKSSITLRRSWYHPEIAHKAFSNVWFYHLDFDNTFHCKFFLESSRLLKVASKAKMFLFGQYTGKRLLAPFEPVPYQVDTAQALIWSSVIQESNITWGVVTDRADGEFIEKCAKALRKQQTVMAVDDFIVFHNRLRWNVPLAPCTLGQVYEVSGRKIVDKL